MGAKRVEKVQADQEQRVQRGLEDPEKLARLTLALAVKRRGLNGNAVLNEGRVQVGVGQRQAPVPLPDVSRDLSQAVLEDSDAPARGLLCKVLVRVGAQGPLGENQVWGQDDVEGHICQQMQSRWLLKAGVTQPRPL